MKQIKLDPTVRKEQLLDAALRISEQRGYMTASRDDVAAMAGCAASLVSYHFGTMPNLRRAIMSAAIDRKNLTVLAQGLAMGESKAKAAPAELRAAAVEFASRAE
jgi:AcrR family transcriptional regulator